MLNAYRITEEALMKPRYKLYLYFHDFVSIFVNLFSFSKQKINNVENGLEHI